MKDFINKFTVILCKKSMSYFDVLNILYVMYITVMLGFIYGIISGIILIIISIYLTDKAERK